jgi:Ca2+-binding EF-hand superfamily protein
VQLRQVFSAVDSDHSGAVSISELTRFVWGNENLLGKHGSTSIGGDAAEHAAPPPDALQMPTHGPLAMPTDTEQEAAFDRMDMNGNGLLSLAEIDKAVVEIWPTFNHKKALMRAYKAADLSGDGYIGRREFPHLLKYLVYFNNLWKQFDIIDSDHNGRLDVKEMHEASQMLGLDLSWTTTVEEFGQMDADGVGYVRFDEFCAWCARHMHGTIVADETTQDLDESEVAAVEDGDSVFSDVNEDEGAGGGDGEEDADGHVLRVTCPDGVGPGEVVRCAWHSFVCMVALPEYREPPGCAAAGCD